jgi:signal transduction histidine kinase
MNGSYNLIDLLNQILVLAAQLVEAESASLIIHDRTRDTLVILMPIGPGAEAVRHLEIPKDQGIVGSVYQSSCSVICNDAALDERFYPAIDAASGYTSRQLLCVPLTVKDKRLGAVEAINKIQVPGEPLQGFTAADQLLLEMFSAQAAVAIENARLTIALSRLEEDVALRTTEMPREHRARAAALIAESFTQKMKKSLIPIQGYAGMLHEVSPDPRVDKYCTYIDREMDRLMTHAEVSLHEVLKELESRLWVECRTAGIAFELDMKEDLIVSADKELLLKALENLFLNSRDAMPQGGNFTVTAQGTRPPGAEITVTDSGKGIEVIPTEQIFEPFFSGKRSAAGLGLSIAKKIVELHGGSIHAVNRDGPPGARFVITLPSL